MKCLLHCEIHEVHVRIFSTEAIPKENIGEGKVIEGDRRFELVVRFLPHYR